MGLSSSTKTVKSAYEPQVLGAFGNVDSAFNANKANVADTSNTLRKLGDYQIGQYYAGDPGIKAATGYNSDVLGGRYLGQGNPQLQQMIDQTGNDVANGVNAHLGTRGRTGGDIQTSLLGRELARNETDLRYKDYGAERDRMTQAAGQAPALAAAQYLPLATGVGALMQGTSLPTDEANRYAASVGGLLGQYTNTKSSDSAFNNWLKFLTAASDAAKAASGGGG